MARDEAVRDLVERLELPFNSLIMILGGILVGVLVWM